MGPFLTLLPGLRVPAWDALNLAALVAVLLAGLREAPLRSIPRRLIWDLWPWVVVAGLAGAHAYHLLAVSDAPLRSLSARDLFDPLRGTAVQGGMIGGVLGALVFLRYRRQPALPVLDVLSPGGALAHALARMGCFAAGCCFGKPTDLGFGVTITSEFAHARVPRGIPLHPAQLYEAGLSLVLAAVLHRRLSNGAPPGCVFALYLGGYGAIRFLVQFFRADDAGRLFLGLAHSQYMALAMMAAAVLLLRKKQAVPS